MATANKQLAEVRQYIEDLEEGLALRLDALGARLQAIENGLARLNANLATNGESAAAPLADEAEVSDVRLHGGG